MVRCCRTSWCSVGMELYVTPSCTSPSRAQNSHSHCRAARIQHGTRTPSLHNLGQTRTHEQLSYRDTMRLSPSPTRSVASHCINRQTPVGGPIQLSGLLHEIINRTCVASSSARMHTRTHLGAVQSAQTWFIRV